MDIHAQVDQVVSRIEHRYNNNPVQAKVIEFGRRPYNPRRRQAPLNDSYDAVTNWAVIGTVAIGLWCVAVGFAQTVLWLERLVRHG